MALGLRRVALDQLQSKQRVGGWGVRSPLNIGEIPWSSMQLLVACFPCSSAQIPGCPRHSVRLHGFLTAGMLFSLALQRHAAIPWPFPFVLECTLTTTCVHLNCLYLQRSAMQQRPCLRARTCCSKFAVLSFVLLLAFKLIGLNQIYHGVGIRWSGGSLR